MVLKRRILAPSTLCLYSPKACKDTLLFLAEIYELVQEVDPVVLDFSHTIEITAAASLVIMAHINRIQALKHKDIIQFYSQKSKLYKEFFKGFWLDALTANTEGKLDSLESVKHPFQAGKTAHLKVPHIAKFFNDLKLNKNLNNKALDLIQTAIKEALLNVEHHAYIDTELSIPFKWWQLLWYSSKHNRINFIIYDLGIGVVDSFKYHNQGKPNVFLNLNNPEDVFLETIKAGVSRWGTIERGNGFTEIIEPSHIDGVDLWILSNSVSYERSSITNKITCQRIEAKLAGTLLEWSFDLGVT